MPLFHIQSHGRLQEWVADELGYFRDEGLNYIFVTGDLGIARREKGAPEVRSGAFESYKQGNGNKGPERSDISCACHWAVNEAATQHLGNVYRNAYVVTPGAIMVRPNSRIHGPEDLAHAEIAAGYHSGSHFTAIQALEAFLKPSEVKLKFMGLPMARIDAILDGEIEAVSVWGLSYQILEQLGFRRVVDSTFMIAFMFPAGVDSEDVEKYMRGMKRAQMEIDLYPERHKRHYLNEIPDRFRSLVDVRQFGPGEGIVFLPYTDGAIELTQDWMKEHRLFASAN
ncbi:MAG: hypothetical protein IVW54_01130 [Candidatus Binataceae bacterium]|nr:hypothetical protein [Candidatus Binataceae bacterium]